VLDVIYYYEQARRAGMKPISEAQARTLRAWVRRALPAYWTHSGYLNWDTGLYLYRWHLSRYWAWSAQGLLAIATSQNFVDDDAHAGRSTSSTARSRLYERFTERWPDDRREPGSSLYGVTTKFSEGPHFELARFQALAAEAVLRNLGDRQSEEPPPLYALRPRRSGASRSRRRATTPRSSAVSNGAFPYGGIELARLYDSKQRVVSHIGGRAPAAFGLVVRSCEREAGRGLATARTPCNRPERRPIVLTKSPRWQGDPREPLSALTLCRRLHVAPGGGIRRRGGRPLQLAL
jgi:hypothetical protein